MAHSTWPQHILTATQVERLEDEEQVEAFGLWAPSRITVCKRCDRYKVTNRAAICRRCETEVLSG